MNKLIMESTKIIQMKIMDAGFDLVETMKKICKWDGLRF